MNSKDNPALILFNMQTKARTTVSDVVSNISKNESSIKEFGEIKPVLLFHIDSLAIKARYINNSAPYTITELKIHAAPWSNGKNDKTIDCKIKLRLELIFNTVSPTNNWESSLFAIEFIQDSMELNNKEIPEKSLVIESAMKFYELSSLIRKGIKEIGMNYPITEEK